MDTDFSRALRDAVSRSGRSLDVLAKELAARGTPVSMSALSYWQTGENNPERARSLAALANLERLLQLPARSLINLVPPRRPRGKWHPPESQGMSYQRMWPMPEAVPRLLSRLDATPQDLYVPARISRSVKIRLDQDGYEQELRVRQVLRGGREGAERMIALVGCRSLTQPPSIMSADGGRLFRFRGDVASSLCAFEFLLDNPLHPGDLGMIEFVVRMPPGQSDCEHTLRVQPGVREVTFQVSLDATRRPARCFGFHQGAISLARRTVVERDGAELGSSFQLVVMDPPPGIWGIGWDW